MQTVCIRAGETCGAATEAFESMELFIVDIGQGEVGHVEMFGSPAGSAACLTGLRPETEKSELVAEAVIVAIVDVAGEVPPFGAVVIVGTMVGGKQEFPRFAHPGKGLGRVAAQHVADRDRFVAVSCALFTTAG